MKKLLVTLLTICLVAIPAVGCNFNEKNTEIPEKLTAVPSSEDIYCVKISTGTLTAHYCYTTLEQPNYIVTSESLPKNANVDKIWYCGIEQRGYGLFTSYDIEYNYETKEFVKRKIKLKNDQYVIYYYGDNSEDLLITKSDMVEKDNEQVKSEDVKTKTIAHIGTYYSEYSYKVSLYKIDGWDYEKNICICNFSNGSFNDYPYSNNLLTVSEPISIDNCFVKNADVRCYDHRCSNYFDVELALSNESHPEIIFENNRILRFRDCKGNPCTMFKDDLRVYFTDGTSITLKEGVMYFN